MNLTEVSAFLNLFLAALDLEITKIQFKNMSFNYSLLGKKILVQHFTTSATTSGERNSVKSVGSYQTQSATDVVMITI